MARFLTLLVGLSTSKMVCKFTQNHMSVTDLGLICRGSYCMAAKAEVSFTDQLPLYHLITIPLKRTEQLTSM